MFRLSCDRITAVLGLGMATTGLVLVAPAAAADLGNTYLSNTTVEIGQEVTVGGGGCVDPTRAPSDPISVEVRGPWFVSMSWADNGQWSAAIPGAPGGGSFTITAKCLTAAGPLSYPAVTLTVLGPPTPPKPPPWWETTTSFGRPATDRRPAPPTPPPATSATPGATPRTGAPPSTPPPAPSPTTSTSSPSAPAVTTLAPAPAPGCTDCAKLTRDEPLTAGDELSLSYDGFQPGEQVALVMRSTPVEIGTFTADAAGVVTAEFALPASAEAGSHTLTFSGPVTGDHVVRFRVSAGEEQARETAAPSSEGTDFTLPVLGGAAALLLVGGGLLLYRRRAADPEGPGGADNPGQPTETPIAEPIA